MTNNMIFVYFYAAIFILVFIGIPIEKKIRTLIVNRKVEKLAQSVLEITPKEFFKIRNASNGGRGRKHISTAKDFAGVYILYNNSKKMYYVGQGKRVFQRVNNHFTGHGNGDVYSDYKCGDNFTIKMIRLKESGFKTLNELERCTIRKYNAFSKGYNKTRGNKG